MDQSPTQTPENQECQQDSDCRNGRLLNTEGPKCEKPDRIKPVCRCFQPKCSKPSVGSCDTCGGIILRKCGQQPQVQETYAEATACVLPMGHEGACDFRPGGVTGMVTANPSMVYEMLVHHRCGKPAQKNVHRWGNCVLPKDHAGFCYYRDSDGEARQANYGTAENPARCSDAMDQAGRLNELRNMAYLALRLHWDDADASRMVKEAGDDPEILHKLQGKIPKHPRSIEDTRKLYEQPLVTSGQPGSFQAIPVADREQTSAEVLKKVITQLLSAVDMIVKQRDEALERCSQLELANAALRKAAGL